MSFKPDDLPVRRKSWIKIAGIPRARLGWEYDDCEGVSPDDISKVKSWVKASLLLPECYLRGIALAKAKAYLEGLSEGYRQAFAEEFAKAYPSPLPNQEQEQEQKEKSAYKGGMGRDVSTWEVDEIPFAVGEGRS